MNENELKKIDRLSNMELINSRPEVNGKKINEIIDRLNKLIDMEIENRKEGGKR